MRGCIYTCMNPVACLHAFTCTYQLMNRMKMLQRLSHLQEHLCDLEGAFHATKVQSGLQSVIFL